MKKIILLMFVYNYFPFINGGDKPDVQRSLLQEVFKKNQNNSKAINNTSQPKKKVEIFLGSEPVVIDENLLNNFRSDNPNAI